MAAAIAALGPALGPGPLLGLDLVALDRIPVPGGAWGLGPDLPRRVPLGVPLAWASSLVGGATALKALLGACVVLAFVGAWRLAGHTPVLCRLGSGLVYSLSPFALTRLGVGHWGVLAAAAVLPWALPVLLRPSDDPARTCRWATAMGLTGITGGMYAVVVAAVGLAADGRRRGARAADGRRRGARAADGRRRRARAADGRRRRARAADGRRRRAAPVVAGVGVAQLPWLVPGLVVLATAPDRSLAESSSFATRLEGLWGPLRLVVGQGFWRAESQVGAGPSAGEALLAMAFVGLAAVGARALPPRWGRRAGPVAALGLLVPLASAVPGLKSLYEMVAGTLPGAALREGQRLLPLFMVWLAPAVATGVADVARRVRPHLEPMAWALPSAAALALAGPGLWGVGGRLEPVELPPGWAEARSVVVEEPGTVLALPWHRYLDLGFTGGRRVYNPVADHLGGDVISSSDPELVSGDAEDSDPREPEVLEILDGIRSERPVGESLARLGVRWVVLLHEVDWREYGALRSDPGLVRRVGAASLDLFEVRDWPGPLVDGEGRAVESRSWVSPLATVGPSGPLRWAGPAAAGWMRGTAPAGSTPEGLVALPGGSGPVWFWPAAIVLLGDAVAAAAFVASVRASWPFLGASDHRGGGVRGGGQTRREPKWVRRP